MWFRFKGLYGLAKETVSEGIKHIKCGSDSKACMDLLKTIYQKELNISNVVQIQRLVWTC